jgi:hypothetical protein
MGLIRQWMADWLGWGESEPSGNGKFPPFAKLQQTLGIVGLVLADIILKNRSGLPSSLILIIRPSLLWLPIFFYKSETVNRAAPAVIISEDNALNLLTGRIRTKRKA